MPGTPVPGSLPANPCLETNPSDLNLPSTAPCSLRSCQSKFDDMVCGKYPPYCEEMRPDCKRLEPLHFWMPAHVRADAPVSAEERRMTCEWMVLMQDNYWREISARS